MHINLVLQLTNRLMPFWEVPVVYCKNRRKDINISNISCVRARGQNASVLPPVIRITQYSLATATERWPAEECFLPACGGGHLRFGLSLGYVDTRSMRGCDGRRSTSCRCKESSPGNRAF